MATNRSDDGGIVCEKCGDSFDPRGISAHKASCDGDQSAGEETGADNAGAIPDEDWWHENRKTLAELGGVKPTDEATATGVAMAWTKRAEMARADAMAAVFGECPAEGCSRGINGFEADGCSKHPQDAGGDEAGEDGDGEMTVTIDGKEVSGDAETIRALLGQ